MDLQKTEAPFWRYQETMRGMIGDRLVACAFLLILPTVRYGLRVLTLTASVIIVCVLTETLMCLLMRREVKINDFDSIVTGIMLSALMPPNVPLYVPAVAGIFAIAVVKMPFGGTGHAPFSPTAAGIAFITLCFPEQFFAYCSPEGSVLSWNLLAENNAPAAQSLAALLKAGTSPGISYWNILTGNLAGPIGTASVLMLGGAALYLFGRHAARWEITVAFVLAAGLMALYHPRTGGEWLRTVLCELSCGSLLFSAVFLATEYSTAPTLPAARWIYGALGGVLAMLFRWSGAYEQGSCFAILLLNVMASPIDRFAWKLMERRRNGHGKK